MWMGLGILGFLTFTATVLPSIEHFYDYITKPAIERIDR